MFKKVGTKIIVIILVAIIVIMASACSNSQSYFKDKNNTQVKNTVIAVNDDIKSLLGIYEMPEGWMHLWTASEANFKSFYKGTDLYECWSLPYGTILLPEIITGGNTTWRVVFGVAECVCINGVKQNNLENPFHYQDVKMDMSIQKGATFMSSSIGGTVMQSNGKVKHINSGDLFSTNTPSISFEMEENQELFKNSNDDGHDIFFTGTCASTDDNMDGSAKVNISWTVCDKGGTEKHEYKKSEFEFTTHYTTKR